MSVEDLRAWLNEWHARLAAEAQVHALRVLVSRLMVVIDGKETGGVREVAKACNDASAALAQPADDSALRALVTRAVEVACERGMRDAFWPRTEADWEQVVDDVLGKAGSGRRASDEGAKR